MRGRIFSMMMGAVLMLIALAVANEVSPVFSQPPEPLEVWPYMAQGALLLAVFGLTIWCVVCDWKEEE